MLRWARDRRVFFFEEPLYDSDEPSLTVNEDSSGVRGGTPHLPAGLADETRASRALLDSLVNEQEITDLVTWYYTPMASVFSRQLTPRAIVYDCMRELSRLLGAPPDLQERERELLELVGALADLRPDWQLILLGPVPEYLAGGLPVISTPIHDVVHPYGELQLVHIAHTAREFEDAALACFREDRRRRQLRSYAFLAALSWDHTWSRMRQEVDRAGLQRQVLPRPRKPRFDYLIAGAGFSGSVMAERLAEHGKRVLLVDKRPHVGGNAFDHLDAAGVLIHKYGPHIFHTNSADVFSYLSRFTRWRPYEHRVLAHVGGKLLPIPINLDTVNQLYGWELDSEQLAAFFARVGVPMEQIRTLEDVIVNKVGRELYEEFFHNYTFKQWGLYPSQLDPAVIARLPVRTNRDDRYFTDTYQAMPADGYTALFNRMLAHKNITLELGADYRTVARRVSADELIYSGPIDEYFGSCYGPLPYRSIQFRWETLAVQQHQPVAVINYPNEHDYTRVTEFKHLSGQQAAKTTLVYEYPSAEGDPYYPVPRPENAALYRRYQALAQKTAGVHFVGRLATYRYSDMDQCVAQALTLASRLIGRRGAELLSVQEQV